MNDKPDLPRPVEPQKNCLLKMIKLRYSYVYWGHKDLKADGIGFSMNLIHLDENLVSAKLKAQYECLEK